MVMRKIGRKGDVTITTVILIVLGLAVLVMMILGFTKGWDFIFGKFDNAPSELQTVASACALYVQGGLSIDFCNYRLVGDEIVNCRDSRILASLDKDGVKYSSMTCSPIGSNLATLCDSLSASKKASIKVNTYDKCDALPEGVPGAPTGLVATPEGKDVKLSWVDSDKETGFQIERKKGTEDFISIGSVGKNIVSYTDKNVVVSGSYAYRIRAVNGAGSSGWVESGIETVSASAP